MKRSSGDNQRIIKISTIILSMIFTMLFIGIFKPILEIASIIFVIGIFGPIFIVEKIIRIANRKMYY